MSFAVLVLTTSSTPSHVCDWRRAVSLIVREKAEIVEHNGKMLADNFPQPLVIRLKTQVYVPYRFLAPNRSNVLARDKHTCQYCGRKGGELTLDHVVPRCRGGLSTWENLVTACEKCNGRKGGRSLRESGMKLRSVPVRPRDRISFLILKHRVNNGVPDCWSRYLRVS